MSTSTQLHIVGSTCGTLLGATLTSYAYVIQGGEGLSFAVVGGLIGGIAGYAAIRRQLRLHVAGAAIGSIGAFTLFQVTVCDGSHIVMPVLGAMIGSLAGAIPESIIHRRKPA